MFGISLKNYFNTREGWVYILVFCAFASPLLLLANAVFLRVPGLNFIGGYMNTVLMVIVILCALPELQGKIKGRHLLFYIICLAVYCSQYLIFPENERFLDDNFSRFFISVIPYFFVGLLLDSKQTFKLLITASYLMILYKFYYDIFYNNIIESRIDTGMSTEGEAMWESYTVMPYIIVAVWASIKRHKLIDIVFAVIGVFLSISLGTRGSLVCIAIFASVYLIFFRTYKKKFLAYIIIVTLTFLVIYFYDVLFLGLNMVMEDLGMSTRILEKLEASDFLNSNGRDDIIDSLIPYMKNTGILGLGLFGTERAIGIYSHKLHYELWASFGYVFGSAIILTLVMLIIKTYIKRKDIESREFLLYVCICGFLPLMFSFTFMIWPYFFLAVGYCVGRLDNVELKSLNEI